MQGKIQEIKPVQKPSRHIQKTFSRPKCLQHFQKSSRLCLLHSKHFCAQPAAPRTAFEAFCSVPLRAPLQVTAIKVK